MMIGLVLSIALLAQNASLRGVVTDPSGAVVRGARITLISNTGARNTAVTGDDGAYSFAGIVPGDYTARAAAPDLLAEPSQITIKPGAQTLLALRRRREHRM